MITDNEIIEKIKSDDQSGMTYLYKKNKKMVMSLVTRNSCSKDDAEDILQESMLIFWQKIKEDNLVMYSRISTYLYAIALNLLRKELKSKSRYSSEELDSELIIEKDNSDEREIVTAIQTSINCLSDSCERVIRYYYIDGMNMNEIAQEMNFANSDVSKTKKLKCLISLKEIVKRNYKKEDLLD